MFTIQQRTPSIEDTLTIVDTALSVPNVFTIQQRTPSIEDTLTIVDTALSPKLVYYTTANSLNKELQAPGTKVSVFEKVDCTWLSLNEPDELSVTLPIFVPRISAALPSLSC